MPAPAVGRARPGLPDAGRVTPGRALLALLATTVLAGLVLLAAAVPADAHAALVTSDPLDGTVLTTAPDEASFTFNEPVSATPGSLRVYDADGTRVDDGVLSRPAADEVTVGLGDVADGGHVATYRVTSADGHVVRGAVTFQVGAGSALDDATVAALFAGGDGAVEVMATVVRAVDLAAVLVAVGAMAMLFGVVARPDHRRLARRTSRGAARVGIGAALLGVPLHAVLTSGLGLAALVSAPVWGDTATSSVGLSALTRAAGLLLVLAVVEAGGRAEAQPARIEVVDDPRTANRAGMRGAGRLAAIGASVLALGSLLLDGHTRVVEPAAVMLVGDAVHVAAGALWAGGLVVVARIVRRGQAVGATPLADQQRTADVGSATNAREFGTTSVMAEPTATAPTATASTSDPTLDDPRAVAAVVAAFSGWALWSMLAVVLAGSAMAWVLVREPRALTTTDQGWTLLVKVALVAVILLVAAWNRWRLVPAIAVQGDDAAAARALLRSSMRVEVILAAAVLAVTAVLVGLRPAAAEAGISGAFDTVVALDESTTMNLVVDPNRAGRNEVHLYVLDQTGRPVADLSDVTLTLEQVVEDIGPIERTPEPAGPGHWVLDGSDLAVPGPWTVTAVVGLDRFSQLEGTVEVVVNPR